ncbi:MAG: hypothetical protein HFJ72_08305 [Adlercreutzia sp.]|nr:hypothetical protein [Adlercreutzia sp.]
MPKKNYITYEPINWANGKDNGTPVNADNLNNMEQAIVALTDAVNTEVATDDIEDGAVTGAKIAQGTITKDNLDKTLGESISQSSKAQQWGDGDSLSTILLLGSTGSVGYRLDFEAQGIVKYQKNEGRGWVDIWVK